MHVHVSKFVKSHKFLQAFKSSRIIEVYIYLLVGQKYIITNQICTLQCYENFVKARKNL
jgi:hypothetical protein